MFIQRRPNHTPLAVAFGWFRQMVMPTLIFMISDHFSAEAGLGRGT